MRLSRIQRSRLLAGDYRPLVCDIKPFDCQPGAQYVLNWRQESRTHDEGNVFVAPREPVRWLVVTKVTRRQAGGWLVRFDVTDHRDSERYLRALPPVMTPGQKSSGDGREESYYQATRFGSIDPLPAVPREYQEEITRRAREEFDFLKQLRHQEQLGELHERVRRLKEAHSRGADVGRQLKRVEAAVEAAERRLERDAA